jgi:signal transduction histidine kinase
VVATGGHTDNLTPHSVSEPDRELGIERVGAADIVPQDTSLAGWMAGSSRSAEAAANSLATTARGIRDHADRCGIGVVVALGDPAVVSYANPAFRRLAGAEDGTVIGRPFFEAFPLLSNDQVRTAISDIAERGREPNAERLLETEIPGAEADSVARRLKISLSAIRETASGILHNRPNGLLIQIHDGSADDVQPEPHAGPSGDGDQARREYRPAVDNELVEVNQRLVIAALREQDLKERAEAANEAKSMFLATMSHELRTPLNAIIGYASLLDDEMWGPIQEAQHRHLQRLMTSARHLLGLITDLLTLARVEADKEGVYAEDLDVAMLLDEALSLTMPLAVSKHLTVTVDVNQSFTLHTDRGKVLQILVNLISNAIKFTDVGEITISASLVSGEAEFSVRDTGIGISPAHLDRVFDMFWQVEQDLTRRAGGAGLGLDVSRRLAQLLGGRLTAESTRGVGSKFTLYLPQNTPDANSPAG